MKILIKLLFAFAIVVSLAACDEQKSVVVETKSPPIPDLTLNQILDMSKNERQELERRCLGVTHKTCTDLKSDSFRRAKEFRIASCNVDASFKGLSDPGAAARARRKCDELF
jgi:hypothetical protein